MREQYAQNLSKSSRTAKEQTDGYVALRKDVMTAVMTEAVAAGKAQASMASSKAQTMEAAAKIERSQKNSETEQKIRKMKEAHAMKLKKMEEEHMDEENKAKMNLVKLEEQAKTLESEAKVRVANEEAKRLEQDRQHQMDMNKLAREAEAQTLDRKVQWENADLQKRQQEADHTRQQVAFKQVLMLLDQKKHNFNATLPQELETAKLGAAQLSRKHGIEHTVKVNHPRLVSDPVQPNSFIVQDGAVAIQVVPETSQMPVPEITRRMTTTTVQSPQFPLPNPPCLEAQRQWEPRADEPLRPTEKARLLRLAGEARGTRR